MDIIKRELALYKNRDMAKGTHRVQKTESDFIFLIHCIVPRLFLVTHTTSALLLSLLIHKLMLACAWIQLLMQLSVRPLLIRGESCKNIFP